VVVFSRPLAVITRCSLQNCPTPLPFSFDPALKIDSAKRRAYLKCRFHFQSLNDFPLGLILPPANASLLTFSETPIKKSEFFWKKEEQYQNDGLIVLFAAENNGISAVHLFQK
jgi:hypothetical protein